MLDQLQGILAAVGLGDLMNVLDSPYAMPTIIVSTVLAAALRGYLVFISNHYLPDVIERLPGKLRVILGYLYVYLSNVYVSVDQLACSLMGGLPRETLSGMFGRWQLEGGRLLSMIGALCAMPLNLVDPGHTYRVYNAERKMRLSLEMNK